jgi:hypothetical protein
MVRAIDVSALVTYLVQLLRDLRSGCSSIGIHFGVDHLLQLVLVLH